MSADLSDVDRARLETARRAFRANEPSSLEVQQAVRRIRLRLRAPGRRMTLPRQMLAVVVLALGGLAYAKPNVLGELVEQARTHLADEQRGSLLNGGAVEANVIAPTQAGSAPRQRLSAGEVAAGNQTGNGGIANTRSDDVVTGKAGTGDAGVSETATEGVVGDAPLAQAPPRAAEARRGATKAAPNAGTTTGWGHVGDALARGDENSALTALEELAHSDDPSTRDKAEIGRAELLMTHGNREHACALASSVGSRASSVSVKRQATALIRECAAPSSNQ